jgi:multiple sugar transport system substrate-binding protein
MFQNGRWATPGIRIRDFNWDVVNCPTARPVPSNWQFWGAYAVNANTAHPEEAWQLVQELTSAEVQARLPNWAPTSPAASARRPSTPS